MKLFLVIFFAIGSLVLTSQSVRAHAGMDHDEAKEASTSGMMNSDSKMMEVNNKICPVSKDAIDTMDEMVKQEYKGKTYNLCCKMCVKDFQKDPEKYSKIADDEVAKAAEKK